MARNQEDPESARGYGRPVPGPNTEPELPRLLLTPEEAAHVLGIGRTKVYRLLADGVLPSIRIGGSRRISMAALDQFVRGLEPGPSLGRAG